MTCNNEATQCRSSSSYGVGGTYMPKQQHSCWVCAHKEDFVPEPSICQKLKITLEDFKFIEALSKTVRIVNVSVVLLCILAISFTFETAYARLEDSNLPAVQKSFTNIGLGLMTAFLGLSVALLSNTFMRENHQCTNVKPKGCELDESEKRQLAEILSEAIRIKTISYDRESVDKELQTDHNTFLQLHRLLEKSFPIVHSSPHVTKTVVNKYSLLYEWTGKNSELEPIMLCAHLDVVPTPNAKDWSIDDPFSGEIDENKFIWGRGAIDNKHNVIAQLKAMEHIISNGVAQLDRTVYFAFGHDEEIGGLQGAHFIAKELMARKIKKFGFILDEGPFLIKGIVPGVKGPVAWIANTEKGNCSVKLTVKDAKPGHSSMPENESNVGILANAIARLEARPFPASVDYFINTMTYLGDRLPLLLRVVVSNPWLFAPALKYFTLRKPQTAASVRTTTSVTIVRAGTKINVVPGEASAWVNHRIHPVDGNKENVLAYDKKVIADDRVKLSYAASDTSIPVAPISSVTNGAFRILKETVAETFNGAPVAPTIMMGNTDTRHYWDLSESIYRFTPIVFERVEDTSMFHGLDEKISVQNLADLFMFYHNLLRATKDQTLS